MKLEKIIKITFIFIIVFLFSCTYKYEQTEGYKNIRKKKIYLNVNSLELEKHNLEKLKTDHDIQKKIYTKFLINFEKWIFNKFEVKGKNNRAYISLDSISVTKLNNKKKKKKYFFFKKEVYELSFSFNLYFTSDKNLISKIKINSEIDFTLLDNYSIRQTDEVIFNYVDQLIDLIDDKINTELKNNIFQDFILYNSS